MSKRVILPQPPDPANMNMGDWSRAMFRWASVTKGILEDASRVNDGPLGQRFVVGAFTTNTTVTGTTTGTDLSNFVASFVEAMTAKGLVSPTISRSTG